MKFQRITFIAFAAVLLLGGLRLSGQQGSSSTNWVGIWTTADTWRPAATIPSPGAPPVVPQAPPPATPPAAATQPPAGRGAPPPPVQFSGQLIRQGVHTTFGGERLRVVFSNAFGTAPISVGAAGIALRDKDSDIVGGAPKPVMF